MESAGICQTNGIRWSPIGCVWNCEVQLISSVNDSPWQLVNKGKSHGKVAGISNSFVSAKGSISVNTKKHKQDAIVTGYEPQAKKARIS